MGGILSMLHIGAWTLRVRRVARVCHESSLMPGSGSCLFDDLDCHDSVMNDANSDSTHVCQTVSVRVLHVTLAVSVSSRAHHAV